MEEDRRARQHARQRAAGQLTITPLDALADAYGVATGYEGPDERWRPAPESSVRAALRVMGVACDSPGEINASIRQAEEAPWRRPVPACTVLRASRPLRLPLRVPSDDKVGVVVRTEAGEVHSVEGLSPRPTGRARRLSDGSGRLEALVDLPSELPLGYHRVEVRVGGDEPAGGHLVVVPDRCPDPESHGRSWGWMLQLYALRSERSWGLGDLGDLRELLRWSAGLGADFAVVNPLHAASPGHPTEPSPYYPSSRRFANPLYLAVDDVPEVRALEGEPARLVAGLAAQARGLDDDDLIDRDAALAAKLEALGIAFGQMPPERAEALARFRDERASDGLEQFAVFCALAERHGVPFQRWPEGLRHPASPAVASFQEAAADRIAFHCWLQMLCDEQLAETQRDAVRAGARLGVVHDLAVGVDKGGADAWALQDVLGLGVSVGAPPDAFNQQGQDWQQPPLLPNRLREQGYAPLAQTLRAVLCHAGGIRIDHVIGLFRLFWIPDGEHARNGTYVRYPAEDLLGVLALEAQRAGAVVIGEDLGTVERGVRERLAGRSVLTSSVLYFERDDGDGEQPRPAGSYPTHALASVTTHDLPTAAGWWTDEEVALRARLDLLGDDTTEEAERAAKAAERERMERLLAAEGLLDPAGATLADRVTAMHAFLARTPALLVAGSVSDAVCDLRQPNMPGTTDEYPNWRLPLAEPIHGGHRQVALEDLRDHPGARRVAEALRSAGRGR